MDRETLDFEIAFYEALVKDKRDFVDALIPLAEAYTRRGLYKKGLVIDKRLVRLRKNDPVAYYNLGCSYALLGEKDAAFKAIEQALKLGYRDLEHLKQDPDLKNLRDDPRFAKLISPVSL